jgi:hypothetical protein
MLGLAIAGAIHGASAQEEVDPGLPIVTCLTTALKSKKDSALLACRASREEVAYLHALADSLQPEKHVPSVDSIVMYHTHGAVENERRLQVLFRSKGIDPRTLKAEHVWIDSLPPEMKVVPRARIFVEYASDQGRVLIKLACMQFRSGWKIVEKCQWLDALPWEDDHGKP